MYICTRGAEEEPLVRKRRDNRKIGLGNGAKKRIVKIRRETWRRYLIPLEAQKMMLVAEECLREQCLHQEMICEYRRTGDAVEES